MKLKLAPLAATAIVVAFSPAARAADIVDSVSFGDAASEKAHSVTCDLGSIVQGSLGDSARMLSPRAPATWDGGTMSFTLNVDPVKPNYVTVRLWGSDTSPDRLTLYVDGKQIGYRHLGDIDQLDIGNDAAPFPGRFVYKTSPLPLELTKGKSVIPCEIRSSGPIWGYGQTWERYQKDMTVPTRGIYAIYAHTDPAYTPPSTEKQGEVPSSSSVRSSPGPEVLDALKVRVNREITGLMGSKNPLTQPQIHLVSRAYFVKWTAAYQSTAAADKLRLSLDALYASYVKDPKLAESDPATYNPDWFGLGYAGDCVRLLADAFKPSLDETIADGTGGTITRRAAWSKMLRASVDYHRTHRRQYTNQTMITDLNAYTANLGILAFDPANAVSNDALLHYLYQSVGLEPWLGSETPNGPDKILGDHYMQLTPMGLTKELGFVGYYGEVLDWVTEIYDATRPAPGQSGDARIKAQLAKIARARAAFRYPALDDQGNRAMRAEAVVGWRDAGHYPGDITYTQRPTWDASPLYLAAATLDPQAVGGAQQMLADNQFFAGVERSLKDSGIRVTNGLLDVPDDYATIKAQPQSKIGLPMAPGQPDFVWADDEDGVVAIKNGSELLYASLYWRARNAINDLACVHYITPTTDRLAVAREDEEFEPSGMAYTRPDWTNFGFGNGGIRYPGELHSALAGEKLPIAKIPDGISFKPGDESPYAGRASFYKLRYGNYLIGMNATDAKMFTLIVPPGIGSARNLATNAKVIGTVTVAPHSTIVLYFGK